MKYLIQNDVLYCMIPTGDTGDTLGCPAGSGACLVKKGTSEKMGDPHQRLKLLSDDELQLHYEVPAGATPPAECSAFTPTVTVVFVCPREEGRYTGVITETFLGCFMVCLRYS